MKHILIQFERYRKWKRGSYYLIRTRLPMTDFWSEKLIASCGGIAIKEEHYSEYTPAKTPKYIKI